MMNRLSAALLLLLLAVAALALGGAHAAKPGGGGQALQEAKCQECSGSCPDGYFCCPNQNQCVPDSSPSCLCKGGKSQRSSLSNDDRVGQGKTDCGGAKCSFC